MEKTFPIHFRLAVCLRCNIVYFVLAMMNATRYTNVNGRLMDGNEASLPVDNKAFRYGQGLFETMLFIDGRIMLEEYHWERLFGGMNILGFNIPPLFTAQYLEEEVQKTVRKNQLGSLCRVRLQMYAGGGGLYENIAPKPEFVIECFPLEAYALQLNEAGLEVGIATGLYKSNDSLANLKSSNALIYAMAAQQAKANKWNDALVLNNAGNVIESTIANIFCINDEFVNTPPLNEGCVAGVMRRYVLERLQQLDYTIQELPITVEMLDNADSVFLTNAIKRIRWVGSFRQKNYKHQLIADIHQQVYQ